MNVFKFKTAMYDFSRVYVFIRDGFNKIFLMEFFHSGVFFRSLKCGTSVFGKPDNCRFCSSGSITISLIIFTRVSDSLVKYSVTVKVAR